VLELSGLVARGQPGSRAGTPGISAEPRDILASVSRIAHRVRERADQPQRGRGDPAPRASDLALPEPRSSPL